MKRFVCALAATLVALLPSVPANADYGDWHWPHDAAPFTITYSSTVDPTWAPYVDEALARWASASQNLPGSYDVVRFAPGGGQLLIRSGNDGDTGWSGLTSVAVDPATGHIYRAIIDLNDYYLPAWADVERRHTICHELGHVLGLPHNDQPQVYGHSCLEHGEATSDPAAQTPSAHETLLLDQKYLHADAGLSPVVMPVPGALSG